ncbi:TPA: oxygen-sensing cyclic-di-GMP phosphodiesterase [Klebsiella pneumoniae]|nr:oxygen-sensing cyclic-di-GMP phosphodiesterase [Klebsiella pneumoniae]HBR1478479.1 oxygen-sensing cyclic-di-GMP phosphodiesterase [Klebsiella pneumoniae]
MNANGHADSPERRILFPALEQSMIAVVLIDSDDKVQFFNEAAEQLWGYSRETVLGNNVSMLIPRELRGHHSSFIRHNREGGVDRVVGMKRELALERRDGSRIWASFALSRAEVNGEVHYLAMARDVTSEVQRQEENHLLLMAMDHTDQPVIILSPSSRIVQVNQAFSRLYSYEKSEVLGLDPAELLLLRGDTRNHELFRALLDTPARRVDELNTLTKKGESVWVRISASLVSSGHSGIVNRVLTFTDVTESQKIRTLEKVILSTLVSGRMFEETGEIICRQVESILPGVRVSLYHNFEGKQQLWAKGLPPQNSAATAQRLIWPVQTGDNRVTGSLELLCPEQYTGKRFAERVVDVCTHFCSLALEQENSRRQLQYIKQFDTLTGLPSRSRLHLHLDQWLHAHPKGNLAVLCLSIDNFSVLNEMNGYAVADQLLLAMAERLQQALLPGQYLSRTEGIQFMLVAPGYDADKASAFASELGNIMKVPVVIGEKTFGLTISTGIGLYPCGGRDILLEAACRAMERLRDSGGDGWLFFDPDVNNRMKEEQQLAEALKRAIAEETLTLNYQPQVWTDSGELYGLEALARWTDPTFGRVSPTQFISLADKIGETGNLGNLVLKEACRQLSEWRQQGLNIPAISINLSPKNFRETDLPSRIASLLKQYGLPGECLTVEMTESDMMEMSDSMMTRLADIRSLGVGLSVDDFGTGFSGLQNLARLPVTEIKIEKSFIEDMLTDKRTRSLTEAMTSIGHSLGLIVVAEGVETQSQLDFLHDLACPVIQGYLFSVPLPPDEIPGWILQHSGKG